MTTATSIPVPAEIINALADKAVSQWPAYEAEYNRLADLGHHRDYAPFADLCSNIWQDWLTVNGKTMEEYERGGASKIMNAARPRIESGVV